MSQSSQIREGNYRETVKVMVRSIILISRHHSKFEKLFALQEYGFYVSQFLLPQQETEGKVFRGDSYLLCQGAIFCSSVLSPLVDRV